MDPTQAPPGGQEWRPEPPVPASPDTAAPVDAGIEGPGLPAPPEPDRPSPQGGLLAWVAIVAGGSLACALLGHAEVALFFAGAGGFALAQATDATAAAAAAGLALRGPLAEGGPAGLLLRALVRALVPGLGALLYLGLGAYSWQLGDSALNRVAAVWGVAAAVASLLLVSARAADRTAAWLFRGGPGTSTRRLSARLIVLGLMLPVPMQALLPDLVATMRESGGGLVDAGTLVSQLLGELAVALAGVGWLVRRRWPATAARLGLGAIRPAHTGLVLAGLAGAFAINAGMESLQHIALPELWRRDQEMTRLIAGQMPVWTALLLGISAGFGEEIALRGALQPRLGIVLTAVFFACGHVQYSWFGMLTIALLGVLLGLVRRQANTSAAIAVHVLYDVFAVVTSQA